MKLIKFDELERVICSSSLVLKSRGELGREISYLVQLKEIPGRELLLERLERVYDRWSALI